ncbi:MAG: host specificity factor TipJ family phage tail protein [Motiliproteus sp.]
MITVVECSDPFDPSAQTVYQASGAGQTVEQWLIANAPGYEPRPVPPISLALNGAPLPPETWADTRQAAGDTLLVCVVPQADWVVYAVIMIVSALVSYALVPDMPTLADGQASSVYDVGNQGNHARHGDPVPFICGRVRWWPDLLGTAHEYFEGNEQWAIQHYALGHADTLLLDEPRFGETPFSSFPDVAYTLYPPNTAIDLLPRLIYKLAEVGGNEASAQGLDLGKGVYTINGGSDIHFHGGTDRIGSGYNDTGGNYWGMRFGAVIVGQILTASNAGANDGEYQVTAISTTAGQLGVSIWVDKNSGTTEAPTWAPAVLTNAIGTGADFTLTAPYSGPFRCSPIGKTTNNVEIDLICPRGLNSTVTVTVETRLLTDTAWILAGTATLTAASNTPQRFTKGYSLAEGEYEIRLKRTDAQTDQVLLAGVRGFISGQIVYPFWTLAAKYRASNNLSSQSERKVSVMLSNQIPTWTGSAWSAATDTANPVWVLCYVAKHAYGGQRTDADLNLAELLTLAGVLDTRGDTCNAVLDAKDTFKSIANKILRCGRSNLTVEGGLISAVRDEVKTGYDQLFTPWNIGRGSFQMAMSFVKAEDFDSVTVEYTHPDTFKTEKMLCQIAGKTALYPKTIKLPYITDRQQAYNEGMFEVAKLHYRNVGVKFSTGQQALRLSFGSSVAVSHDIPAWAQSGELIGYDGGTLTGVSRYPLAWGVGNHYVSLRKPDGSSSAEYLVTQGATANDIVFPGALAFTPRTGKQGVKTQFSFGEGTALQQQCLVRKVSRAGEDQYRVETVLDNPTVHTFDGLTPPV